MGAVRKGTQQVLLTEPSFSVLLTPPKSRLVLLTQSLVENASMSELMEVPGHVSGMGIFHVHPAGEMGNVR